MSPAFSLAVQCTGRFSNWEAMPALLVLDPCVGALLGSASVASLLGSPPLVGSTSDTTHDVLRFRTHTAHIATHPASRLYISDTLSRAGSYKTGTVGNSSHPVFCPLHNTL